MERRSTYISINKMLGKEGKVFVGVSGVLPLHKIHEVKTEDGKTMVVARAPINGRSKMIASMLNADVHDEDNAVWVDVVFRDKAASRLLKYVNGEDYARVNLNGSMRMREWTRKDGTAASGPSINVFNWIPAGSKKPKED